MINLDLNNINIGNNQASAPAPANQATTADPAPAAEKHHHLSLYRAAALKSLEQSIKDDLNRIHKANDEFKKSVNGQ